MGGFWAKHHTFSVEVDPPKLDPANLSRRDPAAVEGGFSTVGEGQDVLRAPESSRAQHPSSTPRNCSGRRRD